MNDPTPAPISDSPITLLRGGWLAAWDGQQHQIIPRGEIAFQGKHILYAGPHYEGRADIQLDNPGWFLCPGFINLHGHIGVELMAAVVDVPPNARFAPSLEFVRDSPLFLPRSLTSQEQQQSAEFSLVQMVKCGATTIVDVVGSGPIWWLGNAPEDEEMLVDTVGKIGCRAYLALGFRSARVYQNADHAWGWYEVPELGMEGLRVAREFARRYRGAYDGRVQVLLTPHAVDISSPALLQATLDAARSDDLLIQIHAAQYPFENEYVRAHYGDTPIGYLHRVGFLGPDITLGHCVFTSGHPAVGGDPERDLNLIAESGSSVAHSPLTFARVGEALHTLPRYLDHGINVGIGCDIWPADIIAEMRLAWFMGKLMGEQAERPTCREVFHAATVGSANALQRPDLGRLAQGARADIVCIDLARYHFGPVLDPIRSLITCGTGQDVDTIFVDGQKIIQGRHVLSADEDKLRATAPSILQSMAHAATARDPLRRNLETILSTPADERRAE